jgi:cytochrome c biogenesis protein CcmG, thiol:disulfide interchange protein DsbE
MTLRQQWITVFAILAVLAAAVATGAYVMREQLFPVGVGTRAPNFSARTVDGSDKVRTLDDYRGKVVILNIWGTFCLPCIEEMPSFERLHRQLRDTNLAIVAVSIDRVVGADSVFRFARGLGVTFDILLDSTGVIEQAYQVTGYPETFVIARDGTIRRKWIGADNWSSPSNLALVRGLLGSSTAQAALGR